MNTNKVMRFLSQIKNNGYTADDLKDIRAFQNKLRDDMGAEDINEALTIMGYLVKNDYIKIVPGRGITLANDMDIIKKMLSDCEGD